MQEYNLNSETDTTKIIIGKLQRMFSSCQINVLVGSAFSLPQLKTLDNIESDLTAAILEEDKNKEYNIDTIKSKQIFLKNQLNPFKQPILMAKISRKKENLLKQLPILLI